MPPSDDGASSGSGYYTPTDTDSDPALCEWVKFETGEADGSADGSGGDSGGGEWFVYGHPEQGAAAHRTVLVRAKSSGRITRVRLGVQVAYNTYEVGKRLGVAYVGRDAAGAEADGLSDDEQSAHTADSSTAGNGTPYITRVADRSTGRPHAEFGWRFADGRWLVRGPAGRTGEAVTVCSRRTGRSTLVFLTDEIGAGGDAKDSDNITLYGFARC